MTNFTAVKGLDDQTSKGVGGRLDGVEETVGDGPTAQFRMYPDHFAELGEGMFSYIEQVATEMDKNLAAITHAADAHSDTAEHLELASTQVHKLTTDVAQQLSVFRLF